MPVHNFGVLIGRFQPFHYGHLHAVKTALEQCGQLLILVGSSNRPRLLRNPWTFEERAELIAGGLMELKDVGSRVQVRPLPDRLYDYPRWLGQVQHAVGGFTADYAQPRIKLFGHERDQTSHYLRDFPDWIDATSATAGGGNIEATSVRKAYFGDWTTAAPYLKNTVPAHTLDRLYMHRSAAVFQELMEDSAAIKAYQAQWGVGPFTTVDSVVVRSGHVLLIKRKDRPQQGAWALPGGFLNGDETLYDGAVRELLEESLFEMIPDAEDMSVINRQAARRVLKGGYRGRDIFDDPHRSERARIISTAHLFDLGSGPLPKLTAADDAADARWAPISSIRADEMFDDHAFIIPKLFASLTSNL